MSQLDDVLEKLSLEDKLDLVRRVRVGSLVLRVGDRVEAGRRLRGSYVDEGLEAEGEDCRIPYDVPAGSLGRVIRVRRYITPFPYGVVFDSGIELNPAEGDVVRVAEQPSEREREWDGALWHIPPGEMFTIRCSRWVDRVGRACPQLRFHRGACGLPPR